MILHLFQTRFRHSRLYHLSPPVPPGRGLSVPGDISVMGHDDLYFGLYPDIGLTTLHTPMTELGKAAIELAVTLMEGGEPPQLQRRFQPDLVVRESTGPLRRPE